MRRVRDFAILSFLITTWFALAQFPRIGLADHWGTNWTAGWPTGYEFWVVRPDDVISSHRFSLRGLVIDVTAWLGLLAAVWALTWLWSPKAPPETRASQH